MSVGPGPSRALCGWLVGGSALALVVLGALLVPWEWVPGGHLVAVSPSEVFTARQIDRAETYSALQRPLGWASLAVSLLVACLLGLTPLGARLARRVPGWWWVRVLVVTLVVVLAGELATLPFRLAARGHAVDYGLTKQALGSWGRDRAVSFAVSWAFASIAVLLVVGIARRSPRRWPLWVGLAGAALTVLGSWVYPVVVEPLFNDFTSLSPGALRSQVLDLAEREHVPVADVLVADASRRTTTLNAYVSGFGSTRRVVLYDNLVSDVPRREALVVVAHELGHARHHDVLVGTVLGAGGVVLGAGLLGLLFTSAGLRRRVAVPAAGQPEAVALLLALTAVGSLLVSPVQNAASRAVEARADRASLEATGDVQGFEKMQVQLATRSLSDPTPPPWSQLWFGSHPTTVQRIGLARALH